MTDDYPFLKLFDGLLISGEDRLIKPDTAIYELAINPILPVSALTGRLSGDLLDEILDQLKPGGHD